MGGRDHSCEICGHGGFNDPHGDCICEPAPDPFTDEDREFLEEQIVAYRANTFADCFSGEDAEALARALAHIDHLEGMKKSGLAAALERLTTAEGIDDEGVAELRYAAQRIRQADADRTRIRHLEGALREIADHLPMGAFGTPIRRAQEIARAALRTSEDGDAG